MSRQVEVGLLGAGGIGDRHARSIAALADARLRAVCDLDPHRAEALASQYGGNHYTNFDRMMDEEGEALDALFICIPTFARQVAHVRRAAAAGIHLFVEKPLSLSLGAAGEMWALIRAAGIIHSCGYMWRYHAITDEAKRLLAGRRLTLVEGHMLSHSGIDLAGTWFTEQARSGGQIVDQTTHVIDIIRYLAGDVESLCAWGNRWRQDLPGDVMDHSVTALRLANGCLGSVTSSWVLPTWEARVRFIGERLDLTVDYAASRLYGSVDGGEVEVHRESDPYLEEAAALVEAVRRGEMSPVRAPFDDGLKTLAVTLAANRSIARGGRQVPRLEVAVDRAGDA